MNSFLLYKIIKTLYNKLTLIIKYGRNLRAKGPVAQLVEYSHGMGEVVGSIPIRSTTNFLQKLK